MSASSNLDLVRSIYADLERGNYKSVEWADPDIEFVIADGPEPSTRKGLSGMREGGRSWMSAWDEWRAENRELDAEHVLVLVRYIGRGKTSGLELGRVRSDGASLYEVRDGKVTRWVVYWDRDRALADLGLAPETDSNR